MRAGETELRSWMIRGLGGDAAAYEALLRALLPILRQFYRRRMQGQRDEVEDLVQDTLIAVHTRRQTYDQSRPLSGWLFAIARYKMIDHFRKSGRTCSVDDFEHILMVDSFEETSNAQSDVERLLETLPEKQASLIRATRIEGLSTSEAADRHDVGESDVKVSVHRGLKSLAAKVRGSLR